MKFILVVFLLCNWSVFGQENRIVPPNWEELNSALENQEDRYGLDWQVISPSLSYLRELVPSSFYIMEIDLSQDLRRQAFQDKTPLLITPKNKFIISEFNLSRPVAPKPSVIITGRRKLDYTVDRGIKNTVYKDASFYTGAYNPFTGLPY